MADLTLPEVITRFRGNEARIVDFTNGNAAGYYTTVDGKKVETLPSLVTRLATAIAAASATRTDLAASTGAALIGYGSVTLKVFLDDVAKTLAATKKTADAAMPTAGGTMTGALILAGAPTSGLHATSKDYVDGQAVQSGYLELTQSGSFPKPANAKWIYVEIIGAGCAGNYVSSVPANGTAYTAGGGGGDMNAKLFRASELPASVAVTIGAGSTGAASGQNATPGGDTKFGSLLTAKGGVNGSGNPMGYAGPPPHSWAGGEPGRVTNNGSNQISGVQNGGRSVRGGGGGGGAYGSNYSNLSIFGYLGGESSEAGKGGDGNSSATTPGNDGAYPGGGGGGCVAGTRAGNGANGRARIWWW